MLRIHNYHFSIRALVLAPEGVSRAAIPFSNPTLRVLAASVLFLLLLHPSVFAQHVHQFYYNNVQWADQDLTSLTNGGIPDAQSGIAAFYTTPNKQFHIYYVANNEHVHQLYYNNINWSDQDLTAVTGGMSATPGTEVSGFSVGNLQHVFFLGSDLHVHQLYYNNATWADQDITSLGGGVVTDFQNLLALVTMPNHQFHVYYLANNSNSVHQLYFNGSSWSDENLSAITGAVASRSWTAGFVVGNQQHVFLAGYDASDNLHLNHLYYNNVSWTNEDISAKVSGLPLSPAAGVTALRVPSTSQLEAYAITNDLDLHQFSLKNNKWTDIDLTASLGGPLDGTISQIAAFPTTPNKQFHVFYESGQVYQFFFNGTNWSSEDIGGVPWDGGGMAGFSVGNLQHLFYLGS